MMYRYRLQFLSNRDGDYGRQMKAASLAQTRGRIECRSYRTGSAENLAVLVEREEDIDVVIRALPPGAFVGAQNV